MTLRSVIKAFKNPIHPSKFPRSPFSLPSTFSYPHTFRIFFVIPALKWTISCKVIPCYVRIYSNSHGNWELITVWNSVLEDVSMEQRLFFASFLWHILIIGKASDRVQSGFHNWYSIRFSSKRCSYLSEQDCQPFFGVFFSCAKRRERESGTSRLCRDLVNI